jgi:hypothetical protein
MIDARMSRFVTGFAIVAAIAACTEAPTPNRMVAPDGLRLGTFNPGTGDAAQTADPERLEVCKRYQMTSGSVPASTSFNFESVADPASNQGFTITSAANGVYACREIWVDGSAGGNVTVTEPAIPGFTTRVTRIQDVLGSGETTPVNDVLGNSLTGPVNGGTGGASTGQLFLFTNIENVQEPGDGCTYTQGYWKTHSTYGPAGPADDAWNDPQIGGPDATFFFSGKSWIDLFNTAPKGNAYIILAHQYMAAAINIENGAGPAPAEFASATTFFNNAANTLTFAYSKTTQNTLKGWAGALAGFNEGLTGPGHCSD